MGKLEMPLTWALVILVLGYFVVDDCCRVPSLMEAEANNGFSWSTSSDKATVVDWEDYLEKEEIITEDNVINVDSSIARSRQLY